MSTFNKRIRNTSGSIKLIVIIIAVILVAALAGYLVYANSKDTWPFNLKLSGSVQSTSEPSVEINKLVFENEVLTVGVKLHNVKDDGHCVLVLTGKQAGLTIDDSKDERNAEAQAAFKDCTGWSLGAENLPAGEYNVEVKFVGPNGELTAAKKVTIE